MHAALSVDRRKMSCTEGRSKKNGRQARGRVVDPEVRNSTVADDAREHLYPMLGMSSNDGRAHHS